MFVNHCKDQNRAQRDPKYTYETGPYQYHVGPNPPEGAKDLGILYPRASTLGGCVSHNALIWINPHDGGEGDEMAVLDLRFRVRGVAGLRVVDASVFPDIPGVFIQSAVVMVGEKAADDIISGR